jgi:hypothetical protein
VWIETGHVAVTVTHPTLQSRVASAVGSKVKATGAFRRIASERAACTPDNTASAAERILTFLIHSLKLGKAIAITTPIIATPIITSTSEKPFAKRLQFCEEHLSGCLVRFNISIHSFS